VADALLYTELERFVQMSEEQRCVAKHHDHIANELLTRRCPREDCRQAFADFTGCLDLTCSRCQTHFCGICNADCGGDAHDHIKQVRHAS